MSLMFPPAPDDPGMMAAIQVARYLHRDLVEGRAAAWVYCFAIFTSKFQGSMGVLATADGQGARAGKARAPKRFWAMACDQPVAAQGRSSYDELHFPPVLLHNSQVRRIC